jgi:hypothetical protein
VVKRPSRSRRAGGLDIPLQAAGAAQRAAGGLQPHQPLGGGEVDADALTAARAPGLAVVGAVGPEHVPLDVPPLPADRAGHGDRFTGPQVDLVRGQRAHQHGRASVMTHPRVSCSSGALRSPPAAVRPSARSQRVGSASTARSKRVGCEIAAGAQGPCTTSTRRPAENQPPLPKYKLTLYYVKGSRRTRRH